jgi:hypothetical protein
MRAGHVDWAGDEREPDKESAGPTLHPFLLSGGRRCGLARHSRNRRMRQQRHRLNGRLLR